MRRHDSPARWEWVVGLNLMGVVHGINAFLPTLEAQGEGHIVNTASTAGITAGTVGPYGATKHAVAALSESRWFAMQAEGTGVGVSVLCPGFVRTNVMTSDSNWPARLGPVPSPAPGSEALVGMIDRAVAKRMPPAQIVYMVAEAITANRFWVLTHPDMIDALIELAETIANSTKPRFPRLIPAGEVLQGVEDGQVRDRQSHCAIGRQLAIRSALSTSSVAG